MEQLSEKQLSVFFNEAKELSDQYEKLKSKEAYHINVIDELHANENAHTRILVRLLEYNQLGRYPILETFLSLLQGWPEAGLRIGNPQIDANIDYIDGLIECPRQYAVIIENKIHWAADQYKQIERYVLEVKRHGIPADKIWVVYLTSDGNKIVEDYSYTEKVKAIIQDRFVTLNYRYDILPWLKETVLPECRVKEEWLITALKQYIDHLEGLLGLRVNQKTIQREMEKNLLIKAGLADDADPARKYQAYKQLEEQFSSLLQLASNGRASIEDDLLESFTKLTMDYFDNKHKGRPFVINNKASIGYYQVRPEDWPVDVHLEWIPFRGENLVEGKDLTIVLHIERVKTAKLRKLVDGLNGDNDFSKLPGREDASINKKNKATFLSITIPLEKAFIYQSDKERQLCLARFYDEICKAIPYVDQYLKP